MSTKKSLIIEKLKLPIPQQINLDMINYLGNNALWNFVFDWDRNDAPSFSNIIDSSETTDNGFATITYSIDKSITGTREDNVMNNFGNWVNFLKKINILTHMLLSFIIFMIMMEAQKLKDMVCN